MRVAYFTPLQPVRSGISDYNEDLIPYLLETGLKLDFFYETSKPENEYIVKHCESYPHTEFPGRMKADKYDQVVYHLGNHRVHDYMYNYIFDFPGVLVLHDFFLHHSRLATYVETGNLPGYLKEMRANDMGKLGEIISAGMGGELLYYMYPLNKVVLDTSQLIIMHNSYYSSVIRENFPGKNTKFIPHNARHRKIPKSRTKQIRKKLSIPDNALIVASFGFMNEVKKIGLISQVLRRLMPKHPDLYYLICGQDREGVVRGSYFDYPEIRDRVKVSGYVEGLEQFTEYMEASDIVLNLRFPSAGETSGTMIRSMAQGKPVVVYDLPTLSDIPDDALVKIPYEADFRHLYDRLSELITDRSLREKTGKAAFNYAREELDMKKNASMYRAAIEASLAWRNQP